MKFFTKSTATVMLVATALLLAHFAQAQAFEHTYNWGNAPYGGAAYKVQPNTPQGYVIVGNDYTNYQNIDVSGIDEFGQQQWLRTHAVPAGISAGVNKCFTVSGAPLKIFVVTTGYQNGTLVAYTLVLNAFGMKLWDRISPLPGDFYLVNVISATNGGWIAVGGCDDGFSAVKFDAYGNVEWTRTYPVADYSNAWSIAPAVGGGYILAGGTRRTVMKIDFLGNYEWSIEINLGNGPNGSPYDFSQMEEITPLPNSAGFLVTGQTSSYNGVTSYTAVYTARLSYTGSVTWVNISDPTLTSAPDYITPQPFNAIINGSNEIVTSWKKGPQGQGGALRYQRMNFNGVNIGGIGNYGNTIPVEAGYVTKAHGKFVIAGTAVVGPAAYNKPYSYVNSVLPFTGQQADDRGEPTADVDFFAVSPNPTSGVVQVEGALEEGTTLRVISVIGAVVLERQIQPGETLVSLDLTSFGKGIYSLKMKGKAGTTTKQVVVE